MMNNGSKANERKSGIKDVSVIHRLLGLVRCQSKLLNKKQRYSHIRSEIKEKTTLKGC